MASSSLPNTVGLAGIEVRALADACGGSYTVMLNGCTPGDVLHTQLMQAVQPGTAQRILLRPDVSTIKGTLQQYKRFKREHPGISAFIVVPRWLNQKWHQALRRKAKLVHTYSLSTGQSVLVDSAGAVVPQRWDWEVWHDEPSPIRAYKLANTVDQVATGQLLQFTGEANGERMRAFVDSGATDVFVSESFCKRSSATQVSTGGQQVVHLGDGSVSAPILGECTLRLRIQGYRGLVRAYVLPDVLPGFDLALGSSWLAQHGAIIDYRHNRVQLYAGTRLLRLVPLATTVAHVPRRPHRVVAASAMARTLRRAAGRGDMPFWVSVHAVASAVLTGDAVPPAADGLCSREAIDVLLSEYQDVSAAITGMPPDRGVGHTIPLLPGDHKPPARPLYRLSPLELQEVRSQVTDLLAKGLIEPSTSPYAAPILFVKKNDGSLRMCIDYRALNRITVRNQYPLPRIDDLLDQLAGASVFSSLDLQSGYHQIRITEEDRPKTAFKTPMGLYQFKVLSFGLTNAPSTFQAVMNDIFGDLIGKYVMIYLDDILIYSRSAEEHLVHLRTVLQRLREHKLYIKLSKCDFNCPELPFLGHIVGRGGVKVDPAKVKAVREYPRPRTLHDVRAFLGLANYFRRFMRGFAAQVAPLTDLTRGPLWDGTWMDKQEEAFQWVKSALTAAPVLALPDFALPPPAFCGYYGC